MSTAKLFALADCDNFFVSCERLFAPALAQQPVAVLSSNDGCVIARSNEVKALGVAMGAPAFKYRALFDHHQVRLFSSNFALYQDMSRRVFAVLGQFSPDIERYSVDESFLGLERLAIADQAAFGARMRARVERWTGIPITVGIGRSKTEAKAAAALAKREAHLGGVLSLADKLPAARTVLLDSLPVEKVWGIGPRLGRRLDLYGIRTAAALAASDPGWLKSHFSVNVERIGRELSGLSCIPLNSGPNMNQTIIASRSFGRPVGELAELRAAVATFTAAAARKLRRQAAVAATTQVYLYERLGGPHQVAQQTLRFPSAYTPDLTRAALTALEECYRPGVFYKKAGIMLGSITPDARLQLKLLDAPDLDTQDAKRQRIQVVDALNRRWGQDTLQFAAEAAGGWRPKQARKSPRYTSDWHDLPRLQPGGYSP